MKTLSFRNMIKVEDHDMIQKLAYVYWYEHVDRDGWTYNNHKELYEKTKNEVMDYGNRYSEDNGN
jgi:hypothetical protein